MFQDIDINSFSNATKLLDVDWQFKPGYVDALKSSRAYCFVPGFGSILAILQNIDDDISDQVIADRATELSNNLGWTSGEVVNAARIKALAGKGPRSAVSFEKTVLAVGALNDQINKHNEVQKLGPGSIIYSGFSISNMPQHYQEISDKERKAQITDDIAQIIGQSKALAGEFVKGNRTSIDIALQVKTAIEGYSEFAYLEGMTYEEAIYTPADLHKPTCKYENFSTGRLQSLPAPFSRNSK